MATSRKVKNALSGSSTAAAAAPRAEASAPFFPYARYISIVGVHTSLLAFVALFVPRAKWADFASPSLARSRPKRDGMVMMTENPLRTVGWMIAGVLVLQVWWGGWVRYWALDAIQSMEKKDEKLEKEPKTQDATEAEKTARRLKHRERESHNTQAALRAGVASLAFAVVLHVVAILFGAPVIEAPERTFLLCLLLSLLTMYPTVYTLGVPTLSSETPALVLRLTWVRLFAELSPRSPIERALVYPVVGAFLGCWTGIVPIGLDWDRPWQAWPLTPAWGALGGYILGSLWAMLVSNIKNLVALGITAQRDSGEAPRSKSKAKSS